MFFLLSKILDVLLSPYTWGLLLVACTVPFRAPRSAFAWRRQRRTGIAALGVLLFFSLEPVSNRLMYRLEKSGTTTYRTETTYDAVVLLGGVGDEQVYFETGEPSYNDSVERLIATHRLLAEGRARFAIVSGGPEDPAHGDWSEAHLLGRQLTIWGIDPSRVLLEDAARNTRENALFVRKIAGERGIERVLVVTSAYHMKRARECFVAIGMPVDTLAVDFRAHVPRGFGASTWLPRVSFLGESTKALREIAGLYIYRLQGYAKPAP